VLIKEKKLPGYQPVSVVAVSLETTEDMLLDFHRKGWIQAAKRNGTLFIASDQRYRAKYILFLRQTKNLTDEVVSLVLETQRPPYSAAAVDEILGRSAPA
jgi:hypothetical protein